MSDKAVRNRSRKAAGDTSTEATQNGGTTSGTEKTINVDEGVRPVLVTEQLLPDGAVATQPAKKTRAKAESKKASPVDYNMVSGLIQGGYGLASLKLGEHWAVSKVEADQIAIPLAKLAEKYNLGEQLAKISDGFMLVLALVTITVPRIMISQAIAKNAGNEAVKQQGGGNSNAVQSPKNTTDSKQTDNGVFQADANGAGIKALVNELSECA